MTSYLFTYISVIAGALSAFAWMTSALVNPVITASYWDSLPKNLIDRQRIAGIANAVGALLAAIAVASQAYASHLALSA